MLKQSPINPAITNVVFEAFLKCPTKGHLEYLQCQDIESASTNWNQFEEIYRANCRAQWISKLEACEFSNSPPIEELKRTKYSFLINVSSQSGELYSRLDAVERISLNGAKKNFSYIPIRTFSREKLKTDDKLLLAFDAIVLSTALGRAPCFGQIVHGKNLRTLKIKLSGLMKRARSALEKLSQHLGRGLPDPVLNNHCAECKFRMHCRRLAEEKDDLSLLPKMSATERTKLHSKGIFSVQQLSYTFRSRRKPKHLAAAPAKYSHALKALAIREQKIHVLGTLNWEPAEPTIFLDVESIPDRDFYYLIGLRIKNGESCTQHSLWANGSSDEKAICASLINILDKHQDAQIICYGSYEKSFLMRMAKTYPDIFVSQENVDRLTARLTNLLQITYGRVYFPTYSNGLKDVSKYLGFRWSQENPSALNSIMWRLEWEISGEAALKERLLNYNMEDCAALESVFNAVVRLGLESRSDKVPQTFVQAGSLSGQDYRKFKKNDFTLPDLEYINSTAYWDYQRSKIYVRSNRRLQRLSKPVESASSLGLPLNGLVEDRASLPSKCPRCSSTRIRRYGWLSNKVCDLKFSKSGIKRWIVKYRHPRICCSACKSTFSPSERYSPHGKYGPGFMAYLLYGIMELRISQAAVARNLNQFFGFRFARRHIQRMKYTAAKYYENAYQQILLRLAHGNLVHVDETKIRLEGREAFVWVFANFEDVAYVYSDTREAAIPRAVLPDFRGVLVTDFYTAYDSLDCRQQKCLIHLIRDLNDDLRRNPFNAEIQEVGRSFALLLRPIIETIDRYGLKKHHLRKHLKSVDHFYKFLARHDYQSEIAQKYRKRFDKNRTSLFTFLKYDCIPWNNNNAEHAIKALANLRNTIGGTSSPKGIREYLVLLSISQSCKYRGINFLEFVRSGKQEIEDFAHR